MSVHKLQRKSGPRYQVKWRRLDGTQASKIFPTKKEAERFEAQITTEKSKGIFLDDRRGKTLFRDVVAAYLANKTHQRTSTIRRREGILAKHILPVLGDRQIRQIRYSDVQTMVNSWVREGLAPRTIKQHIQVIKPIFDYAIKDDMIPKNPTTGLELPKCEDIRRRALTPDECHRLLDALPPYYRPFVHTVLATGMRWAEATSLRVSDLNLLRSELSIRTSKTEAGHRDVALDSVTVNLIAQHLAETGRNAASGDELLFTSPNGTALHSSNFRQRVFTQACRAAGLDHLTFHELRHTHITALLLNGVDPRSITQRIGHRTFDTTLKHYAQPTETGRQRAAIAMGDYLTARTPSSTWEARDAI